MDDEGDAVPLLGGTASPLSPTQEFGWLWVDTLYEDF